MLGLLLAVLNERVPDFLGLLVSTKKKLPEHPGRVPIRMIEKVF